MVHQDLSIIVKAIQADPAFAQALHTWWISQANADETFSTFLYRLGILNATTARGFLLLQRSYMTESDLLGLLASNEINLRAHLLTRVAPWLANVSIAPPCSTFSPNENIDSTMLSPPVQSEVALLDTAILTEFPNFLPIGTQLGKYKLESLLGHGGFGLVYRARHQTLNIPVAVKVLRWRNLQDGTPPATLERFANEARLLAQVNHPNVVRVWDFEEDRQQPFLVLEFVDGPSLTEVIQHAGAVSPKQAVGILQQLVLGLQAAWQFQIVHHDIKPGNILLTHTGVAKITDFGLARLRSAIAAGSDQEIQPSLFGTVEFMAPEQAARQLTDHRTDMYALGVTLYEMLTGQLPFRGRSYIETLLWHASKAPVPPIEFVPTLPPALNALTLRLLAKQPDQRFQTYEELLTELDDVQDKIQSKSINQQSIWSDSHRNRHSSHCQLSNWLGWKGLSKKVVGGKPTTEPPISE